MQINKLASSGVAKIHKGIKGGGLNYLGSLIN